MRNHGEIDEQRRGRAVLQFQDLHVSQALTGARKCMLISADYLCTLIHNNAICVLRVNAQLRTQLVGIWLLHSCACCMPIQDSRLLTSYHHYHHNFELSAYYRETTSGLHRRSMGSVEFRG